MPSVSQDSISDRGCTRPSLILTSAFFIHGSKALTPVWNSAKYLTSSLNLAHSALIPYQPQAAPTPLRHSAARNFSFPPLDLVTSTTSAGIAVTAWSRAFTNHQQNLPPSRWPQ